MADRLPPTAEEYQFLTDVSSEHGVPIRRASELYFNSPDSDTASTAYRIMRRSVDATLTGAAAYCIEQLDARGISQIKQAHQAEIQVYPKIDVFNSIWSGIPEIDTTTETPFVDAQDFLKVTTSDTSEGTLAVVKATYEEHTFPAAMHDAVLKTCELLKTTPAESMGLLMRFLDRSFAYSGLHAENQDNSTVIFQGMLSDYDAALVSIRSLLHEGMSMQDASHEVFRRFYPPDQAHTPATLIVDELDVQGIREICKIQRRPYSEAELETAQLFVDGNEAFTDAVTAFHYLLADYTRGYLAAHPERMQYTFRDFNTMLLVYRDEKGQVQVGPNPDMLSSFSNNWFGSIARAVRRRLSDSAEATSVHAYDLTAEDIAVGITNARRESVFRMRVGMFNRRDDGLISWSGTMLRVCPAEKIATDTGVEVVPRFYNSLVGNSKYKAEAESGVADTELAKLLGNKLRSTAITLYITGEASTGKSRIMQEIAKRTELPVIDVGLGYRLAARLMSKEAFTDLAELSARMRTGFSVTTVDGECRLITSSGNDITNELRSSEIDQYASEIGPEYDELILDFLRMHMNGPHLVAARNTALTKDAPSIVVDLTCEPIERAKRRARQMKRADVEVVSEELRQREAKSARHYTDKPEDALTIDTTTQSPETVVTTLVHMAISRIELMNGVRKEGDAK